MRIALSAAVSLTLDNGMRTVGSHSTNIDPLNPQDAVGVVRSSTFYQVCSIAENVQVLKPRFDAEQINIDCVYTWSLQYDPAGVTWHSSATYFVFSALQLCTLGRLLTGYALHCRGTRHRDSICAVSAAFFGGRALAVHAAAVRGCAAGLDQADSRLAEQLTRGKRPTSARHHVQRDDPERWCTAQVSSSCCGAPFMQRLSLSSGALDGYSLMSTHGVKNVTGGDSLTDNANCARKASSEQFSRIAQIFGSSRTKTLRDTLHTSLI